MGEEVRANLAQPSPAHPNLDSRSLQAFVGQSSGVVFKNDMTQRAFNPLVESLWHLDSEKQLNGQITSRGLPLGFWLESCVEHTNGTRINSEH